MTRITLKVGEDPKGIDAEFRDGKWLMHEFTFTNDDPGNPDKLGIVVEEATLWEAAIFDEIVRLRAVERERDRLRLALERAVNYGGVALSNLQVALVYAHGGLRGVDDPPVSNVKGGRKKDGSDILDQSAIAHAALRGDFQTETTTS